MLEVIFYVEVKYLKSNENAEKINDLITFYF